MDIQFIGWCREGTADKVWCVIKLGQKDYIDKTGAVISNYKTTTYIKCWGRRGKKLNTQIKQYTNFLHTQLPQELTIEIHKKTDKGYLRIDKNKLDEVYSDFENDLKKTAMWSILMQQ